MAERKLEQNTLWTTGNLTRLTGLMALIAFAYFLGAQNFSQFAIASHQPGSRANDHRHVEIREVNVPMAPLKNKGDRVVVGAADGGFYLVDYNGFATPVQENRRDLHWR